MKSKEWVAGFEASRAQAIGVLRKMESVYLDASKREPVSLQAAATAFGVRSAAGALHAMPLPSGNASPAGPALPPDAYRADVACAWAAVARAERKHDRLRHRWRSTWWRAFRGVAIASLFAGCATIMVAGIAEQIAAYAKHDQVRDSLGAALNACEKKATAEKNYDPYLAWATKTYAEAGVIEHEAALALGDALALVEQTKEVLAEVPPCRDHWSRADKRRAIKRVENILKRNMGSDGTITIGHNSNPPGDHGVRLPITIVAGAGGWADGAGQLGVPLKLSGGTALLPPGASGAGVVANPPDDVADE